MTVQTQSDLCRPHDIEFFERELESFLPERVFDAHAHLWHHDHQTFPGFPDEGGYEVYQQLMAVLHPRRLTKALFIPFPTKRPLLANANECIGRETALDPDCRGLFIVTPEDDPEWVRQEVRRLGLHGLKCYHTYAPKKPTWISEIPAFLPEPLIKVAHEEGWVITLHMVGYRATAEQHNIECIRHYCQTYPNMTLILAHSARGFNPAHNFEGLPHLTGLENLYFDTSANCEAMATQSIIRILGHERLMYGTDSPVSHGRGRSVATADTFIWLYEESPVWEEVHTTIQPVLTGLEHLRAIKWACWSERLSDNAVEDIFFNNAARLFGLA
jgi:predicted TIM-barrel fold metal-dependent hydrolase